MDVGRMMRPSFIQQGVNMIYEKKRGRPTKKPDAPPAPREPEPTPTLTTGYSITKPADQYVVKLGGSVVYASRNEEDANKYVKMTSGK